MGKGDTNSLAEIMGRLRDEFATPGELILPTPLGPISVDNLTNIKGWVYELTPVGFPGVEAQLVAGGAPVVLADYTDEKGWILSITVMFRSPYGVLNYVSDSHNFSINPFLMNAAGLNRPNASMMYVTTYNPFTPFGPLYGIAFTPTFPFPYERLLRITFSLPLAVPIAVTNIFAAAVSRIKIIDEALFHRSIKKFTAEQMIGRKLDRYP